MGAGSQGQVWPCLSPGPQPSSLDPSQLSTHTCPGAQLRGPQGSPQPSPVPPLLLTALKPWVVSPRLLPTCPTPSVPCSELLSGRFRLTTVPHSGWHSLLQEAHRALLTCPRPLLRVGTPQPHLPQAGAPAVGSPQREGETRQGRQVWTTLGHPRHSHGPETWAPPQCGPTGVGTGQAGRPAPSAPGRAAGGPSPRHGPRGALSGPTADKASQRQPGTQVCLSYKSL